MKKIYVLLILIVFGISNQVKSQYLIPSYNIDVASKATFVESQTNDDPILSPAKVRDVVIHVLRAHANSVETSVLVPNISVWLYSLDGLVTYGPFSLATDQTSFPIDNRQWGVLIVTSQEIVVDVSIE